MKLRTAGQIKIQINLLHYFKITLLIVYAMSEKEKTRYRGFFVTINSNQPYQNVKNDYDNAVNDLFTKDFKTFVNGNSNIKSIDINYANETGSKQGLAHTHALIEFQYTGEFKPKVDYRTIPEYIKKKLGVKGVHFNSDIIDRDERDIKLRYIYKDAPNAAEIFEELGLKNYK